MHLFWIGLWKLFHIRMGKGVERESGVRWWCMHGGRDKSTEQCAVLEKDNGSDR